jgi:tRNA(Ile)-lysidine synthase
MKQGIRTLQPTAGRTGMIDRVFSTMEKYQMIEEGNLVAAGVSGGADSLCLMLLLLEYQKKVPFSLIVVHVNHGIRQEAARDAAYVKELCHGHGLPFFLVEEDVQKIARDRKMSEEEAGRQLRYDSFRQAIAQYKQQTGAVFTGEKIAVAHHQEDTAETFLFHLFRGTGINGLGGIPPVRENIIRPLSFVSRREIEEYLRERGISWCIDSTNEEDTYSRNKIRNHLLPYAEKELVNHATLHVAQAAEQLRLVAEYLKEETIRAEASCVHRPGSSSGEPQNFGQPRAAAIIISRWKELPELIKKQLLLYEMEQVSPGCRDITSAHIEALAGLAYKEGNKKLNLPGGLQAVKEFDLLWIRSGENKKPVDITARLSPGMSFSLGDFCPEDFPEKQGFFLEISLIDRGEITVIEEKKYTKYFDYDRISNHLTLRFRQSGDYLTVNTQGQSNSIKKYFIQEKIPAGERCRVPLVAEGSHVLWVIGHRISAYYKVTEETKRILRMRIWRREDHGRNS